MDRQKGFHQGHGDLVRLKRDHSPVAANDLVMGQRLQAGCAIGGRFWLAQHGGG